MSKDKLQTKRQIKQGGFRRLYARMGKRKQRVTAAASSNMDISGDVPSVGIGRSLMIILVLHVVAIGAILIGTKGGDSEKIPAVLVDSAEKQEKVKVKSSELNKGLERRVVKAGDNYKKLANRYGVSLEELRRVNHNTPLSAGLFVYLPPKKITVAEADSVQQLRQARERIAEIGVAPVSDRPDLGLNDSVAIDAAPVVAIPQAKPSPVAVLVKPKLRPGIKVVDKTSLGATYKVKAGDSIWRIAHNHKVKQDELLKLNGISDPRHLKEGMILKIPN